MKMYKFVFIFIAIQLFGCAVFANNIFEKYKHSTQLRFELEKLNYDLERERLYLDFKNEKLLIYIQFQEETLSIEKSDKSKNEQMSLIRILCNKYSILENKLREKYIRKNNKIKANHEIALEMLKMEFLNDFNVNSFIYFER